MTSTARLTYYNGFLWRTMTLPDGTRAVQPLSRNDNGPLLAQAEIRYYRKITQA